MYAHKYIYICMSTRAGAQIRTNPHIYTQKTKCIHIVKNNSDLRYRVITLVSQKCPGDHFFVGSPKWTRLCPLDYKNARLCSFWLHISNQLCVSSRSIPYGRGRARGEAIFIAPRKQFPSRKTTSNTLIKLKKVGSVRKQKIYALFYDICKKVNLFY